MFHPKLFTTLKDYSLGQFWTDLAAGIVVGILAIPLAIAFSIASGVSPEKGLITAFIAGFLISAFGGSRVQIGGPTGAFVVIVYGIVQKYGTNGLVVATFIAGIILILMGLAKFGTIIKFIPHSVIVGFTSGIAVIIFSSQIKDFLGLNMMMVPVDFIEKWFAFAYRLGSINCWAAFLAVITVSICGILPKFSKRVPGALIAIVATSAIVGIFKLPVETIGSRFGELPRALPLPCLPVFNMDTVRVLFQPAFTIALLCSIESLLSAVVSDGMIGGKHRSNTELIGQGIANIGSALFGGIPATGAIARTVTNIRNGGRTPVAGLIHALTVLCIMLLFGKFMRVVPLACLAGILVVVAYHMSEWRSFKELILQGSAGGKAVLLTTFFVTVFVDLPAAIEIGVVLSAFLFMKRMSDITTIRVFAKEFESDENNGDQLSQTMPVPAGVQVYEINGPLFFGAANRFDEVDRAVNKRPKVRILRFRNVPLIDSTGLYALKCFCEKCKKSGIPVIITGLHVQPLNEIVKSSLSELVDKGNIFSSMNESIERAKQFLK